MVLIKVEDREQFGQGNRSRGVAAAQSLSRIGIAYCIISSTVKWYEYLKSNDFNVVLIEKDYNSLDEVASIKELFSHNTINFILLDGDRFDIEYIELLIKQGIKSVILDDVAKIKRTNAWRLINPNIYANDDLYAEWEIIKYLGSDFLMLREAFLKETNTRPIANKILLALGVMMDLEGTKEIALRLDGAGFSTKIATGLSPEQMVDEIDSSSLIICGASVTLHEVWTRNRRALPVYQAKDQILFHEFLKKNNLPQVVSINRSPIETIDEIVFLAQQTIKDNKLQIQLSKTLLDDLLKELVKDTN
jgi:spore coat polysaccharide biosynthesis predicted glycosyltransferase SpsG